MAVSFSDFHIWTEFVDILNGVKQYLSEEFCWSVYTKAVICVVTGTGQTC